MAAADAILREFPELNDSQREAVSHTEGPLLVIAGPGSGKTLVLVVRALNILLQGLAQPSEVLLCTFTEKAAFEMRDRLSLAAKKLGYPGDLSELLIGTIHGICNEFLLRSRHKTPLGNGYDVLDELTQLLFIFDHFDEIIGTEEKGKYLGRWTTRWTAIQGARDYFNKITEELIEPAILSKSTDPFVRVIGTAYQAYVAQLFEGNCVDFAHQQRLFLDLLKDPGVGPTITGPFDTSWWTNTRIPTMSRSSFCFGLLLPTEISVLLETKTSPSIGSAGLRSETFLSFPVTLKTAMPLLFQ
jgi:DNA helicase II / ATP-dependent DNA helicase PcrA